MAGIVGLGSNNFFRLRSTINNADDAINTGLYSYEAGPAINGDSYGLILCFANYGLTVTWAWGAQLFIGESGSISIRSSIRKSGVWSGWTAL